MKARESNPARKCRESSGALVVGGSRKPGDLRDANRTSQSFSIYLPDPEGRVTNGRAHPLRIHEGGGPQVGTGQIGPVEHGAC